MSERLTDEHLRKIAARKFGLQPFVDMAGELIALRAVWKIVEPHLPPQVYRRALDVIGELPQ